MSRPAIGVDIDDFRMETKAALQQAADLDLRAVEVSVAEGALAPSNLSSSGRRHLTRHADGLGLQLSSFVADMRRLRLTDQAAVDERVARTCAILEMARDMGVPFVTAAVERATDPEHGAPDATAIQALSHIGEYADSRGVTFCIRPALDGGERLAAVLDALRCPAIRVCLDPAAMVIQGVNPLASVETWIGHAAMLHARDGTAGLDEHAGSETPLGAGDVDIVGLLAVLDAGDVPGPYILRRTDSTSPVADISDGRDTLCRLLPPG